MKNIIIIFCTVIITITLSAFAYTNWNGPKINKVCSQPTKVMEPPIFFYNLSPPSKNTITKVRMHNAKTISDLIPDYGIQENLRNNITSLRDVKIRIEEQNAHSTQDKSEKVNGNSLSKEQIILLKSTDYSSNFHIEGFLVHKNLITGLNEERYFNYDMTVIPEKQASYKNGNKSFIDFMTSKCQSTIAKVQRGKLKYGKISFTITKAGTIENIDNFSTCGYTNVDKRMMDLMNKLPDDWNVATDSTGEKVNQNLVFSYGQTGC